MLLIMIIIIIMLVGNFILSYNNKHFSDVYKDSNNSKYIILVEVDNKVIHLIDKKTKEVLTKYPIATGEKDSPTPIGTFEVNEMGRWGEGFGTRWIGLNVSWGRYGIHGTNKPGSIGFNASAGCIRMNNSHVEELYDKVTIGTNVVITNGPYGPFAYGYRSLRPGDRGADVLEVQKRLFLQGYYNGSLDGIYGEGMKANLIEYLKDKNMTKTDTITEEIYKSLGIVLIE